jgi:hypothetical protein
MSNPVRSHLTATGHHPGKIAAQEQNLNKDKVNRQSSAHQEASYQARGPHQLRASAPVHRLVFMHHQVVAGMQVAVEGTANRKRSNHFKKREAVQLPFFYFTKNKKVLAPLAEDLI